MRSSSAILALLGLLVIVLAMSACQTRSYPPLQRAQSVDVPRFMGAWYVIGCIPSLIERHEYNAVETYRLGADGRIRTVFTYNNGSFDGPFKRMTPVGFVTEGSRGTIWGMRFIWPIKADYRIMYVNADYSQTVVGREKRDYAWIMARSPSMPDSEYQHLSALLRSAGYDTSLLRKVPQRTAAAER